MVKAKVWFPIFPQVKERARFRSRRRGGPYTPEKTVEFEKAVRRWWSENGENFADMPIGVEVEIRKDGFYVTVYELECSVRPARIGGDIDNYLKSIFDGLQPHKTDPEGGEGAFSNDRQIEKVSVWFYGEPRKSKAGANVARRANPVGTLGGKGEEEEGGEGGDGEQVLSPVPTQAHQEAA